MSKLDEFKEFVKVNPSLIKYVKNDEMTWQKFYELYDLYGEDNDVWNNYLFNNENSKKNVNSNPGDFLNWLKSIDLDSVREGVNSLQRVIGVIQDFNIPKNNTSSEYQPRPLYKHFED